MRSLRWMVASLFAAVAAVGMAVPAQAAPGYPKADGRCVDQTQVLGPDLCAKVTAVLLRDEKSTSDEIAVAVVPTTGEATIEAWSTGLFNRWGVGKKDKNNGVLLVVALDDHKIRLETGAGAQKRLSDGDAVTIVDDVTSHFSADEYALGILTGLDDVRRELGHTVPAGALLVPLAETAPAPADQDLADGGGLDGGVDGGDLDIPSGLTPPEASPWGDNGLFLMVPLAIGGFLVVALFAIVIAARNRSAGIPAGTGRSSLMHHQPGHRSASAARIAGFTTTSSGTDSSGSSGSGFGGGSSDGGGATGSW